MLLGVGRSDHIICQLAYPQGFETQPLQMSHAPPTPSPSPTKRLSIKERRIRNAGMEIEVVAATVTSGGELASITPDRKKTKNTTV